MSFIVIIFFIAGSCKNNTPHLFTPLSSGETGIHFKNTLQESATANVLNYAYFYNGGGVAIGDINNDGLPDILFTGNMVSNRLYLNNGDGYMDLFVGGRIVPGKYPLAPQSKILLNGGKGTFTDATDEVCASLKKHWYGNGCPVD